MRSYFATLRQLVLPAGSPPGSPAVVIGVDMPPALTQFYAAQNRRIVGGIVMRTDAGNYVYDVLRVGVGVNIGAPVRAVGAVDSVNGVAEQYTIQFVGAGVRMTSAGDQVFNGQVTFGGDALYVGGKSLPRGLVARIDTISSTPDIGLEAVVLTTPAMSFLAGRAYRVEWQGPLITSTPNQTTLRVRKNDLAGALLAEWNVPIANSGTNWQATGYAYVRNSSGVAVTNTAVALTMAATAGITRFQATTTSVATVEVRDCGAAADYANAISI